MADLLILLRKIFCFFLGCFYASLILLKLFIDFIRAPLRFPRETFWKKRNDMPACLNDPSLGSHRFIHLEGVKLHYVTCGDEQKPLMLMLHGYPGFWYSWKHQIQEFSRDYRVVAVDQRGYADSDKPAGWQNYTIEKLSEDIRQLIPALGHKSCVLVAHDWGGSVAWNFACNHPNMVDKLIVMNGAHKTIMHQQMYSNICQFFMSWYMFFFQVPLIPELMFMGNDMEMFSYIFDLMPNNRPTPEEAEAYKYAFSSKGAVTCPLNWYRAAFRQNPGSTPVFEKPALVIWGEPDAALSTALAYKSKQFASDLTVKTIPDSHHYVIIDKYKEVNEEMRQFLSQG